MSVLSRVLRSLRSTRLDRELDEELAAHLHEAVAHGREPSEARRALGSPPKHRQASRDALASIVVDGIARDVRFGLRQVWRHRLFAGVAMLFRGNAALRPRALRRDDDAGGRSPPVGDRRRGGRPARVAGIADAACISASGPVTNHASSWVHRL